MSLALAEAFDLDDYGLILMRDRPLTPSSEAMISEVYN